MFPHTKPNLYISNIRVHACLWVCVPSVRIYPWRPDKCVWSPSVEVSGNYKRSYMSVGKWTRLSATAISAIDHWAIAPVIETSCGLCYTFLQNPYCGAQLTSLPASLLYAPLCLPQWVSCPLALFHYKFSFALFALVILIFVFLINSGTNLPVALVVPLKILFTPEFSHLCLANLYFISTMDVGEGPLPGFRYLVHFCIWSSDKC